MRRAMRSAPFVVLAVCGLAAWAAVGGCGKDAPPAGGGPAAPAAGVRLLDAGTGERAPIRFAFAKGTRQTHAVVVRTDLGPSLPTGPMTVTQDLATEIVDVAPDGTATVVGRTSGMKMEGGAGPPPAGLDALTVDLRMTLSARGEVLASEVHMAAPGLDPALAAALQGVEANLRDMLSQIGVVWPAEPVGPGARWVVDRAMKTGFMDVVVSVETTLVARTTGDATLRSRLTCSMGEQDLQPPGSPVKLHVKSMRGTGTMDQRVDFASPVSAVDSTMEMTMVFERPARPGAADASPREQTVTTKVTQQVTPKR